MVEGQCPFYWFATVTIKLMNKVPTWPVKGIQAWDVLVVVSRANFDEQAQLWNSIILHIFKEEVHD